VEEVGSEAVGDWRVGDRIAGMVHGGLFPDKGAFAQYLKVPSDLAWRPSTDVTDEQAATYGISAVTAMQGLFTQLDIPWPSAGQKTPVQNNDGPVLLVYAGSTAASLFTIQLATLVGYRVVTTCSPHNFDLVKSYGAFTVYDYHSPSALSEIKLAYPDISRAFDGISLTESINFCSSIVEKAPGGGKVVVLLDPRKAGTKPNVEIIWTVAYTLFGLPFEVLKPVGRYLGLAWGEKPEDREALVKFYAMLPELTKSVKAPPIQSVSGGFEGLFEALDLLRTKKVSGKKLVVSLV
jgi:NADPH:quinone reductase-like Zn-dependent oxidoreductase